MVNIKGGVGKTLSSVNIAACLSEEGKRVLIVDVDPQSNATKYLNRYDSTGKELSTYDVLVQKGLDINDVIVTTDIDRLDLVPSNIKLEFSVEAITIDTQRNRENRLKRALEPIKNDYDYIIIDSSPFLSILTTNILVASDSVLVPIKMDLFALDGIGYLTNKIEHIKEEFNPDLKLMGFFITIFEKTRTSRQVLEHLENELGDKLFRTKIRKNQALLDSTYIQTPIIVADSRANASVDYRKLAKEVFNHE
jgi:chromosome partitioning protein